MWLLNSYNPFHWEGVALSIQNQRKKNWNMTLVERQLQEQSHHTYIQEKSTGPEGDKELSGEKNNREKLKWN